MYNRTSTPQGGASLRLRIRTGDLARSLAPEPDGSLEQREPDDLYAPLDAFNDPQGESDAAASADAACGA